jgi:hypothetical protein
MSKVIKLIKAIPVGRNGEVIKYVDVKISTQKPNFDDKIELRCYTKIGATVWIDDDLITLQDQSDWALKHVKQSVIEEMFGEFRPLIRDLYMATYENDPSKMRALLDELSREMFEI